MYNFLLIRQRREYLNHYTPGEREVVILLRGLSRSHRSWLGFQHDLSEHFDVICLDLPGLGLSKQARPLWRVQAMAQELAGVIKQLNLRRCFIVAPSLGAMVSLELARILPLGLVQGLVIMAPSHSGVGFNRVTRKALQRLGKALRAPLPERVALSQQTLVGRLPDGSSLAEHNPGRLQQWAEAMHRDSEELGAQGQLAQIAAALSYTSLLGIQHVRTAQIPLKCVIPAQDQLIPVAHARAVYQQLKHPYAAVIELEHAGHDLVVTHDRQLRDIVTAFVKELSTYTWPPESVAARQKALQQEAQQRLYTSLGLVSMGLFLISWLLRDRSGGRR